ncbi:hypothetical protein M8009_18790, partial [Halomonas sp. ATCH28]
RRRRISRSVLGDVMDRCPLINRWAPNVAGQGLPRKVCSPAAYAEAADLTGRYRATEITALLMGGNLEAAREIAERLRWAVVRSNDKRAPDQARLSPSIRVAELWPDERPFYQRLEEAWQFHS